MSELISSVRSKLLNNHGIKVKSDWIEECVGFFSRQSPDLDDQALYLQAYEQFLLADLKEASNPMIPAVILQKKESFTLNGTFVLQMEFLIDIAESPYDQWRRLHNVKLDEVLERNEFKTLQSKKKRTLKLELTDGHKNVCAMEYTAIPSLNTKLLPGSKLQIIGPLQVVNHILLLETKNLKVLGGDVEDLLIVNAYENVLLKALNKPTTQTPIKDYKEEIPSTDNGQVRSNIAPRPISSSTIGNVIPESEQNFLEGIDFDEEEDVDMEMLMKIEKEEKRANEGNCIMNQIAMDDDDDLLAQIDMENLENAAFQPAHESLEVYETPERYSESLTRQSVAKILIPDESRHDRGLRDLHSKHSSIEQIAEPLPKKIARVEPTRVFSLSDDRYQFKTQEGDNIVTIDQYLSLKTSDKMRRNYVVYGRISSTDLNTIRVRDSQWHLNCDLTDSYSHQVLSVKIPNRILEMLSGATGLEMQFMFKDAKTRPQVKDDILKILKGLQLKLDNLECFMKLETPIQSNCQLLELLEDNHLNTESLLKKLKEENLKEVE